MYCLYHRLANHLLVDSCKMGFGLYHSEEPGRSASCVWPDLLEWLFVGLCWCDFFFFRMWPEKYCRNWSNAQINIKERLQLLVLVCQSAYTSIGQRILWNFVAFNAKCILSHFIVKSHRFIVATYLSLSVCLLEYLSIFPPFSYCYINRPMCGRFGDEK